MLIHKEKMNTNLEYLKTLIHSKQHSEKFYVCKNNDMLKKAWMNQEK